MEMNTCEENSNNDDTRVTTPSPHENNVCSSDDENICKLARKYCSKVSWIMNEFPLVVCFIVTLCAVINSSPPKVQTTKYPSPFFPVTSLVTDYYQGDVDSAFLQMLDTEYLFMFYYAPWDSSCQSAKWEFHLAARYYHEQVTFIAINCWYPDGQCRKQYKKIKSYPILILYQIGLPGIQYQGPLHLANMIEFLGNAMNPIHALQNYTQMQYYLAKHDALVVGYFRNLKGAQLARFRFAAMKALERDPSQDIKFMIVSHEEAGKELGMSNGDIKLFLWNETKNYQSTLPLDYNDLVKWVFSNCQLVCQWFSPPGVKSPILASFLENSPTLILFTPKNPFYRLSNYYYLLKEVAVDYYSCPEQSSEMKTLSFESIKHFKSDSESKLSLDERKCAIWMEKSGTVYGPSLSNTVEFGKTYWSSCCLSYKVPFPPYDYLCSACVRSLLNHQSRCSHLNFLSSDYIFLLNTKRICKEFSGRENPFEIVDVCCQENIQPVLIEHEAFHEDQFMNEYMKEYNNEICRRLQHAKVLQNSLNFQGSLHHLKEMPVNKVSVPLISGKACEGNRTLNFVAMDSFLFKKFSAVLGIDIESAQNHTAVVLLDVLNESTYVLKGKLTKRKLINFISDFTNGSLPRFMRSKSNIPVPDMIHNNVFVTEVNTTMLQKLLEDESKDLVVLFYTPWCGFTMTTSHVFLNVAALFQSINTILFVRLDLANNDLPWNLTLTQDPSIIVFPQERYAHSRHYPSELSFNTSSIVKFLMLNISMISRAQYVFRACQKVNCDKLHTVVSDHIRRLLQKYRQIIERIHKCGAICPKISNYHRQLQFEKKNIVDQLAYWNTLQKKLKTFNLKGGIAELFPIKYKPNALTANI